ncbi:MAG: hypothetical protein ACM3QZ_06945 [Solirubrobacterales bacterium]
MINPFVQLYQNEGVSLMAFCTKHELPIPTFKSLVSGQASGVSRNMRNILTQAGFDGNMLDINYQAWLNRRAEEEYRRVRGEVQNA